MTRLMLACLLGLPSLGAAQVPPPTLQGLFEMGQNQQVVQRIGANPTPADLYLSALAHEKLDQPGQAGTIYTRLAARPVNDPWRHVGRSGAALAAGNLDQALATARQAIAAGPTVAETHYQLGLVQASRGDYAAASVAFDQAAHLKPTFAYARYHAGFSYYQIKRLDRMAERFGEFLRLAPQAPERGRVESIMRTVRGR